MHVVGAEHEFGFSRAIGGIECGPRQQGSSVRLQGFEEDHLGCLRHGRVALMGPAKAFGVAHIQPVRSSVNRSVETLRVHEGLDQDDGMAKPLAPVTAQTFLAQSQYARSQIRHVEVRQDHKAAVVDHEFQPIKLMAKVPTNPAIAGGALPGAGGEAHQGEPLRAPNGDVPEGFADLRKRTQIVVLLHQILVTLGFGRANGVDADFSEIQCSCLRGSPRSAPYTAFGGRRPEIHATI